MIEGNLGKAICGIRSQVAFWTTLPSSARGCVALSKMVILPRLLYYFTNLLLLLPATIFNTLDTILIDLIWGKGRRLLSLKKLQINTREGGLGAPDFRAYYYACQVQWLSYWTEGRNLQEIDYSIRHIEQGTLHTLLLPHSKLPPGLPYLLRTALHCWGKALRYTSRSGRYADNIPLVGIPLAFGRLTQRALEPWTDAGVESIGALFSDGTLLEHDTFKRITGAPTTLYVTHAALLHYIKRH